MYHLRISSRITSARALGCSGDKSQKVEGRKEGKGGRRWGREKESWFFCSLLIFFFLLPHPLNTPSLFINQITGKIRL